MSSPAQEIERRSICLSLAYKASNYYDALYLRTGSTAADNMSELAAIFEEEWIKRNNSTIPSLESKNPRQLIKH